MWARNWEEFRAAVRDIPSPALNYVYADTADNIGYIHNGAIPIRPRANFEMPVGGEGGLSRGPRSIWAAFSVQRVMPLTPGARCARLGTRVDGRVRLDARGGSAFRLPRGSLRRDAAGAQSSFQCLLAGRPLSALTMHCSLRSQMVVTANHAPIDYATATLNDGAPYPHTLGFIYKVCRVGRRGRTNEPTPLIGRGSE